MSDDLTPEAERLQDTLRKVAARRAAGITVPVRVDLDEKSGRLLSESRRRDALHAAALAYRGQARDVGTEAILDAAEDFAAYLAGERVDHTGDPAPAPVIVPPDPGVPRRWL